MLPASQAPSHRMTYDSELERISKILVVVWPGYYTRIYLKGP